LILIFPTYSHLLLTNLKLCSKNSVVSNEPALMRKVILVFPDVISLTEFVLANKVSKTIIDSSQKMLKGVVSDKVLTVAVKQYGAKIRESIAVKTFGF